MKWPPPPDKPYLKTSEFYGLPFRREIAALRRAGFDRLAARHLMAVLLIDRAHLILQEAGLRVPDHQPRDEVLESQASQACRGARNKATELLLYHLIDFAAAVVDAATQTERNRP